MLDLSEVVIGCTGSYKGEGNDGLDAGQRHVDGMSWNNAAGASSLQSVVLRNVEDRE